MKSITVAAAAFVAVEARNLARMEAQPTLPAVFALEGFSPAPTTPPTPEYIAARQEETSPVLFYNTGNTCGYVSGISTAAFYCINKGDYCALSTSASGRVGRIACCGMTECNFRTTCVGYADVYTSKACNEECRDNTRIVKCTDTGYPFCNTVSFAGGIIDYACGVSDITTYQLLKTTYSGQVNPQSYTRYTVTGTDTSVTGISGSATGAPRPSSTDSSSTSASGSSTAQPTNDGKSSKSKTPVGAIVGGVVGGVGAIALIGIGVLLFLRRKKKADNNNNIQQSPPAPLMSQPQTGGAPPPQGQYAYPDAQKMAYSTSPSATGAYYPPQQQGSPDPNYPYSQQTVSPATSYAPQPYGQQGFGQPPYQQAGSPPPMQQHYGTPSAPSTVGAATGTPVHKDAPSGPVHEAPSATTAGHRGEMQELE